MNAARLEGLWRDAGGRGTFHDFMRPAKLEGLSPHSDAEGGDFAVPSGESRQRARHHRA